MNPTPLPNMPDPEDDNVNVISVPGFSKTDDGEKQTILMVFLL